MTIHDTDHGPDSAEIDSRLMASFQDARPELPADPFVGAVAGRIAHVRRRRRYAERLVQIGGVALLILCSHWLIQASTVVSTTLDGWFTVALTWLATPLGTASLVVGGLAVAAALRHLLRR
jgi:hypothetical protein